MINGVLVERTVGDVLPQLQSNSDNMNKVLVELAKQYKTKQDDMEKWKVRSYHVNKCGLEKANDESFVFVYRKRTRSRSCSSDNALYQGRLVYWLAEEAVVPTIMLWGNQSTCSY